MGYPQPSSNAAVTNGFGFFRLTTQLASPGDIYESLVSAGAFAVGPNSDIANIAFSYFDSESDGNAAFGVVSPMHPFAGNINAQVNGTYNPSKRPGKILFWADDLFNPEFASVHASPNQGLVLVTPVLDVIEYFTQAPSITQGRPDKTFQYQELPIAAGGCFLVVPYYGRKSASIRVLNTSGGAIDVSIYGVTFYMDPSGSELAIETEILAPTTVADGDTVSQVVTGGQFGFFHMLEVFENYGGTGGAGPAPVTIIMSDQSESPLGGA